MGAFPETLLLVQLNMEEPTQDIIINGSILKKSSDKSCRRRRRRSKSLTKNTRRSSTRIVQRVSTLRNLVPNMNNNDDESSLEQLFTHTADYILSLQTRVRFMRTLVDVLSGSSSSSSRI